MAVRPEEFETFACVFIRTPRILGLVVIREAVSQIRSSIILFSGMYGDISFSPNCSTAMLTAVASSGQGSECFRAK